MITLDGLSKRYGDKLAVNDLSLEVAAGKVTGFLGPNGSGKSTTMRMIVGLDHPSQGRALVNGRPYVEHRHPLRELGALLEAKALAPARSARNHLLAMACSNGIDRRRVDEVLDVVGLSDVANKRAGSFSLGMGQRLGIAGALLGDPGVLMFDEPVNGLDTDGVRWVRQLMRSLADEGRTVFVSSHLMSEMQLTADHLLVIGKGTMIANAPIDDVIAASSLTKVRVRCPEARALDVLCQTLFKEGATVERLDAAEASVAGTTADHVGDVAYELGVRLHELRVVEASLEEAYMEMTAASVEYRAPDPLTVA